MGTLPEVTTGDAGATLTGAGGSRFGYQVAAGDLDADGRSDVVVTAPHPVGGNVVYVFLGGHDLGGEQLDPADADMVIQGPAGSENGWSVALGDVTGDGHLDLVVGSPVEGGDDGMVHVFEGPVTPASLTTADASLTIRGLANGYFGWAVAAGDFDGDGVDELAVGGCYEGAGSRGFVHLFDLDAGPVVNANDATSSFEGFGLTGCALANVGDFNADGYEDLVIGSPGSARLPQADYGGVVTIVYGRPSFARNHTLRIDAIGNDIAHLVAELPGENLGDDVAPAGDVNDDGYADFLIGAPARLCQGCLGRDRRGGVYLVLGAKDSAPGGGTGRPLHGVSTAVEVADVMWEAAGNDDLTGVSVASAGFAGLTYSTWAYSGVPFPMHFTGPVMLFGTSRDFAYAIPYDREARFQQMPTYACEPDPEVDYLCRLVPAQTPSPRHVRRDLGALTKGGHRFVGDPGSAFGLEVCGPGDLDGDGIGDLLFGAPDQVRYEDPAGDGQVFGFSGR